MSTLAERHRSPWLPWLPTLRVLWALVPGLALGADFRSGDVVRVGPDEVIEEDLHAFGRAVNLQGTVRGDLITAGQQVDISGTVEGDVMSAASNNRISSQVRGSPRAAGGELSVSGTVGEDAMVPILGGLVALATILFGLGALLLSVVRGREPAGAPV